VEVEEDPLPGDPALDAPQEDPSQGEATTDRHLTVRITVTTTTTTTARRGRAARDT